LNALKQEKGKAPDLLGVVEGERKRVNFYEMKLIKKILKKIKK